MRYCILTAATLLMVACSSSTENEARIQAPIELDRFAAQGPWTNHAVAIPTESSTSEGTAVSLADRTPRPIELNRLRKRMNLDQLEAAFFQTSGGQRWTEGSGNNEVNLFQRLSATLGKPDFIQITKEDLEPSALFQKFLDDAARSVCGKMLVQDLSGESDAILLPEDDGDEEIRANVQRLLKRFHNRDLAIDSPDVDQWIWLFDSVRFVEDATVGWNAVCVALFTHPDFYTY